MSLQIQFFFFKLKEESTDFHILPESQFKN